jgi:hypothetical protein
MKQFLRRLLTRRKRAIFASKAAHCVKRLDSALSASSGLQGCKAYQIELRSISSEIRKEKSRLIAVRYKNEDGELADPLKLIAKAEALLKQIESVLTASREVEAEMDILRAEGSQLKNRALAFVSIAAVMTNYHKILTNSLASTRQCKSHSLVKQGLKAARSIVGRMEQDLEAAERAKKEFVEILTVRDELPLLAASCSQFTKLDWDTLVVTLDHACNDFKVGHYRRALVEFKAVRDLRSKIVLSADTERENAIKLQQMWLDDAILYSALDWKYHNRILLLMEHKSDPNFLEDWRKLQHEMSEDVTSRAIDMGKSEMQFLSNRYRLRTAVTNWAAHIDEEELIAFTRGVVRNCRKGEKIAASTT